ncbi:MAG: InlB B-repeat-containing protein, partial [Oscillospiraceae bacterium]|nr:InlB B-repeat-containing protein [Oscillospiraceae bacterium]
AAGYAFDGWYNEAGVKVSANAEYTFKMPEEATVLTAKFAAKTYSAAVSATTGGLASLDTGGFPADGIPYGTSLTATATVGEGYWFDGWFDGETLVSGELVYTFAMSDGGANLTARFSEKQAAVLVTVSPAEGGTVTIDAGGADVRNIPAGTTVQLRATPAAGQEFAGWFIDGTVLGKDAGYAFVAEKFTYPLEARFQKFGTNDSRENADTGNNLPLAFVLTALSALLAGGVLFLAAKRRRV